MLRPTCQLRYITRYGRDVLQQYWITDDAQDGEWRGIPLAKEGTYDDLDRDTPPHLKETS